VSLKNVKVILVRGWNHRCVYLRKLRKEERVKSWKCKHSSERERERERESMNVGLCEMHSVICSTAVAPSLSGRRSKVRNPNQLRAKSSLLIKKQDTLLAEPFSDSVSVSRRLILLRHAKSSWANRSLRGNQSPSLVSVLNSQSLRNYLVRT